MQRFPEEVDHLQPASPNNFSSESYHPMYGRVVGNFFHIVGCLGHLSARYPKRSVPTTLKPLLCTPWYFFTVVHGRSEQSVATAWVNSEKD